MTFARGVPQSRMASGGDASGRALSTAALCREGRRGADGAASQPTTGYTIIHPSPMTDRAPKQSTGCAPFPPRSACRLPRVTTVHSGCRPVGLDPSPRSRSAHHVPEHECTLPLARHPPFHIQAGRAAGRSQGSPTCVCACVSLARTCISGVHMCASSLLRARSWVQGHLAEWPVWPDVV